jgi:hypothetical protein
VAFPDVPVQPEPAFHGERHSIAPAMKLSITREYPHHYVRLSRIVEYARSIRSRLGAD